MATHFATCARLLVELGFNDLGWGVSNAAGLTADVKTLIANARAAKPNIKVLVANVIHRTPLANLPNLDSLISSYNNGLAAALPAGAPSAIPWPTGPATPTLQSAQVIGPWDVQLGWTEVPAVTGYLVRLRDAVAGEAFSELPFPVTGWQYDVGWLFAGSDRYEFCMVAVNGSLRSAPANCLRARA
jgi:hypothetical protein